MIVQITVSIWNLEQDEHCINRLKTISGDSLANVQTAIKEHADAVISDLPMVLEILEANKNTLPEAPDDTNIEVKTLGELKNAVDVLAATLEAVHGTKH